MYVVFVLYVLCVLYVLYDEQLYLLTLLDLGKRNWRCTKTVLCEGRA